MKGPYLLASVDVFIVANSMGAYVLSRDGQHAHYVGRSDSDLRNRIKSSAKEGSGYKYFWFEHATSPMNAYHLECNWYHKFGSGDNSDHPDVPNGTFWRCPVCK